MVSEVESKGLAKAQGVNRDPADSVPSPLHPGRSLREGRGRWRGSDWGRRGTRLPQRHPGGLGGVCPTWVSGRRDFGRRARGWLRAGTRRDQPSAGPPPLAHPPPPTAAGPERGFGAGRLGSSPRIRSAFTGGGGGGCS